MPWMKGLDMKSLRHHYSLVPLFAALGFGCTMAAAYTARLALQSPDVSWRRRENSEPWQHRVDEEGNTVRYKFFQGPSNHPRGLPNTSYGVKQFSDERPNIEEMWAEHKKEQSAHASHH